MLQIYAIPVSLYCAKLRILLRHKRLEWQELAPPGGYGSDEYKTDIPSGNLPALCDGDLLIADSEAIAEYLEEAHPSPAMLPDKMPDRAHVRERGRFHDTRLEPALRAIFEYLPAGAGAPDGLIIQQSRILNARLGQLGRMLGPYAGVDLTLGDCGLPITFAWMDALTPRMGLDLTWPADVSAYRERLAMHPAVKDELSDYVPRLLSYLDTNAT